MKKQGLKPEELVVPYTMASEIQDDNTKSGRKQHNIDATRVKFVNPITTMKFNPDNSESKAQRLN